MYVRDKMTSNPYVVSPKASISEALELMRKYKIRRLPVVCDGILSGIITERRLLEVSPSPATTLSVFEINTLLSKTTIDAVMTRNVITCKPDDLLEEAAVKLIHNDIGGLPVMEDNKLIGIITEADIFDSFVEILGFRDKGARLAIEIPENRPGVLEVIGGITKSFNINIQHIVFYRNEIILRVDTTNVSDLISEIEKAGFLVNKVDYLN